MVTRDESNARFQRMTVVGIVIAFCLGALMMGHLALVMVTRGAVAQDNRVLVSCNPGDKNDGVVFAYNPDTREVFAVEVGHDQLRK